MDKDKEIKKIYVVVFKKNGKKTKKEILYPRGWLDQ